MEEHLEEIETDNEPEVEEEDGSRLNVLGEEYTADELRELLEAGRNAKSFIASATQKAQEAAELRRQAEEDSQYAELGKALLEAYQKSGLEGAQSVVQAIATAVPREESLDTSEFTENELTLYRIIQQQQAQIAQMSNLYSQFAPKVQDLESFYATAKRREEASDIARAIREAHGVDVPPEEIFRMQESGISDPVKALGYIKTLTKNSPTAPADRHNLVDESDMTADDLFLSRWRGNVGSS